MFNDDISKQMYFELNRSLEKQNQIYCELLATKEYKIGSFILRFWNCIKTGNWKSIRGYFRNLRWNIKAFKSKNSRSESRRKFDETDYFTNDRIAVYTCVFGKYDHLQEPVYKPNNIDYYVITDQKIPENSMWKGISWEAYCLSSYSNVEKNRFFKMHPEIIFPEYKYSIYLDGNIKVISDLTPYVMLLGKSGLGFHYHNQRQCAYKELEAIRLAYKANKAEVNSYIKYLENNHFPKEYGLLECNVIVREHNNTVCKKVMEEWWEQFLNKIKRDQVSLPYVLFKNHIQVKEVAVLGSDVYSNLSLRIVRHL